MSKLVQDFLNLRNQSLTYSDSVEPNKNKTKSKSKNPYEVFMSKYENLEDNLDSFNARDLVYFFREKAKEAGIRYEISNIQKEAGSIKNVLKKYSSAEVLIMIEFLFNSEQTYLEKDRIQPTILSSNWCNTIFKDSSDWVNDRFTPRESKIKESREWKSDNKVPSKVGEW